MQNAFKHPLIANRRWLPQFRLFAGAYVEFKIARKISLPGRGSSTSNLNAKCIQPPADYQPPLVPQFRLFAGAYVEFKIARKISLPGRGSSTSNLNAKCIQAPADYVQGRVKVPLLGGRNFRPLLHFASEFLFQLGV